MKTYTINSEITLTEEQMKDIAEAYNKPEPDHIYPIFKKSKYSNVVIKFTDLTIGVVVWEGSGLEDIGYYNHEWRNHTNETYWGDVAYDRERDLWDKQPIYCWDEDDRCSKEISFYSVINKCAYGYDGKSDDTMHGNYKAIPSEHYDKWTIDAYKKLKE